jgi:hypothetical protein
LDITRRGKKFKLQKYLKLLKSTPVVPLYADIPLLLSNIYTKAPHLSNMGTNIGGGSIGGAGGGGGGGVGASHGSLTPGGGMKWDSEAEFWVEVGESFKLSGENLEIAKAEWEGYLLKWGCVMSGLLGESELKNGGGVGGMVAGEAEFGRLVMEQNARVYQLVLEGLRLLGGLSSRVRESVRSSFALLWVKLGVNIINF